MSTHADSGADLSLSALLVREEKHPHDHHHVDFEGRNRLRELAFCLSRLMYTDLKRLLVGGQGCIGMYVTENLIWSERVFTSNHTSSKPITRTASHSNVAVGDARGSHGYHPPFCTA